MSDATEKKMGRVGKFSVWRVGSSDYEIRRADERVDRASNYNEAFRKADRMNRDAAFAEAARQGL